MALLPATKTNRQTSLKLLITLILGKVWLWVDYSKISIFFKTTLDQPLIKQNKSNQRYPCSQTLWLLYITACYYLKYNTLRRRRPYIPPKNNTQYDHTTLDCSNQLLGCTSTVVPTLTAENIGGLRPYLGGLWPLTLTLANRMAILEHQ